MTQFTTTKSRPQTPSRDNLVGQLCEETLESSAEADIDNQPSHVQDETEYIVDFPETPNSFPIEYSEKKTYVSDRVCSYQNPLPSSSSDRGKLSTTQSRRSSLPASIPTTLHPASKTSTDAYGNTYPEGGAKGYLCVFGAWTGLLVALGIMNILGTYQAYLSTHQLSNLDDGAIGWIFGIYAFLAFFCGIQIGPVFDSYGPRLLIFAGSCLIMASTLLLGVCTQYWHFIIVFGIPGGTGTSLIFTPAISSVGHFFLRRRGAMTGLAATGGSLGGIIYPLMLQSLFPQIGFAWSTRCVALVFLVLLIPANLLVRSRPQLRRPPPPRHPQGSQTGRFFSRSTHICSSLPFSSSFSSPSSSILPNFRIFRSIPFTLTVAGVFFIEFGMFIPVTYITSYSLAHKVPTSLSYQMVAIMNAGSCIGRWLPGHVADRIGRFNAMIGTVALCLLGTLGIWLPSGDSLPAITLFAVIFGFASGSNVSLTPVCVGQLCKTQQYGRYYATCYTVVSVGSLTGVPIAGSILTRCGGDYWGLITFTALCYAVGMLCFVAARVLQVGWRVTERF